MNDKQEFCVLQHLDCTPLWPTAGWPWIPAQLGCKMGMLWSFWNPWEAASMQRRWIQALLRL